MFGQIVCCESISDTLLYYKSQLIYYGYQCKNVIVL